MLKIQLALVIFCFGVMPLSHAEIPRIINHEGYLTDPSGSAITSSLSAIFSLYNSSIGGTPRHSEQSSIQSSI